jgi:hypothetical protein
MKRRQFVRQQDYFECVNVFKSTSERHAPFGWRWILQAGVPRGHRGGGLGRVHGLLMILDFRDRDLGMRGFRDVGFRV